jgi:hydrogenase maturation protease
VRVIGIGNPLRGDDAAGLAVACRVRELAGGEVEVRELEGEPTRLIDAWRDASTAVVVDAASSGAAPGTVMRFDATEGPLPPFLAATSTHALGLGDAVEIARALRRLPPRLIVYAIEGARFEAGEGLTPAVSKAVETAAEAALGERHAAERAARL